MNITTKIQHIATYDVGEGFYVDIVRKEVPYGPTLEEWIWNEYEGAAKMYVIGFLEETTPLSEFIKMIEEDIEMDKEIYRELYVEGK